MNDMRLIDADAVKKRMGEFWFGDPTVELFVDDLVDGTPTIDAIPVVRCKDCKHFLENGGILEPWCDRHEARLFCGDGFCSDGKRKDGGK